MRNVTSSRLPKLNKRKDNDDWATFEVLDVSSITQSVVEQDTTPERRFSISYPAEIREDSGISRLQEPIENSIHSRSRIRSPQDTVLPYPPHDPSHRHFELVNLCSWLVLSMRQ